MRRPGSFLVGLRDPEEVILEAIEKLQGFFKNCGLATTLKELGIGEENLELMAKKATFEAYGKPERQKGNFKALHWQDVYEIYKLAL